MKVIIILFAMLFFQFSTLSQDCPNSGSGSSGDNCSGLDLSEIPTKVIRLTLHVFQDDSGNGNFTSSHESWLENVIDDVNSDLSSMPSFTGNPSASVSDLKIEFDLKNIYFWQNTTLHEKSDNIYSNGSSLYSYIYSQSISYKDNSIHILIPGNDSDGIFGGIACSIGCKDWFFIKNGWTRYSTGTEDLSQLIAHELGHNLNLFHSPFSDQCSDTPESNNNNNIMRTAYLNRYALTECQAGRMHKWLNEEAPELIQSGHQPSELAGTISFAGGSTSLICCTQSVPATSIDIEITSPSDCTINWTHDGGTGGTFSSANNGHDLDIDNLGSIYLDANWYENCKEHDQSWVFYYVPSYMRIGPNPTNDEITINIDNAEEWINITDKTALTTNEKQYLDSWEIMSQAGNFEKKGKIGKGQKNIRINTQKLKSGFYFLILRKSEIVYTYSFYKV